MKTPQEKFDNDTAYRGLVTMLEAYFHRAEFTPSELREACIFAAIRYASYTVYPFRYLESKEKEVDAALKVLKEFRIKEPNDV